MPVLRRHDTLAHLADGFSISTATAYTYTAALIRLLANRAPSLPQCAARERS
ncbi:MULTISPECIES: transposase family protein [Streptomyces]|uniref:transposase family protein n=1 Tax=Streptomyces TaxID=1883 RepID=UPI0036FE714F